MWPSHPVPTPTLHAPRRRRPRLAVQVDLVEQQLQQLDAALALALRMFYISDGLDKAALEARELRAQAQRSAKLAHQSEGELEEATAQAAVAAAHMHQ